MRQKYAEASSRKIEWRPADNARRRSGGDAKFAFNSLRRRHEKNQYGSRSLGFYSLRCVALQAVDGLARERLNRLQNRALQLPEDSCTGPPERTQPSGSPRGVF